MERLTQEQRLTPEKLEAIRKRAEAATLGPWWIEESRYEGSYNVDTADEMSDFAACLCSKTNAEFIAAAREDIPALLAEVEHYGGKISLYLDEIERLRRELISAEMREYGAKRELAEYKAHVDDIERKVLEAIRND